MPLTDLAVKAFKPADKPYKKADGRGLTLLVKPGGQKLWRLRYRLHGKEKMLGLGSYPDVSLSEARAERDRLRKLIAQNRDPSLVRRVERLEARQSSEDTFAKLAEEFVQKREAEGAAWRTIKKHRTLLTVLLPELGALPIREINSLQLLAVLKKVEKSGRVTMAREARALASRIYQFAVSQGRAATDISEPIKGALRSPVVKGHPGITDPDRLGRLLVDIEVYQGDRVTRNCLLLLARLFVRPGELREARWEEIDLKAAVWRIPASRTKLRREHIVPLPAQAIALFEELYELRADDALVAGSSRKPGQPMSDMTFNKALRSLGYYKEVHVSHGFRTTASTLLNEQGYNSDWIERQLAHVESNKVRGAYNAAEYLEGRTRMVAEWNDYLDGLMKTARSAPRS
ncbi:integrase [Marinicauda pacifica]|nr:integrase arm-type DNA-binding domain-containing protein [Marinicauda pacifica]GGE43198.1 integrase [Marinicauda pacifica]